MTKHRRSESVRVKTAKRRKLSSTLWLQRQLNDVYVQARKKEGFRSRASFKLIQLDERFHFLKPQQTVLDLGAAPGGWLQAAQRIMGGNGTLIGVDLLPITPITSVQTLQGDFTTLATQNTLTQMLDGKKPDVILSDMSPNTTGHYATDHLRMMGLVELAWLFARQHLKVGGHFIAKVFQGGTQAELLADIKQNFTQVRHAKPDASRKGSPEQYLIALDFRPPTVPPSTQQEKTLP